MPKAAKIQDREVLLTILQTHNILMKAANRFFSKFIITDVQFNILIILKEFPQGLTQQQLSQKLVVTKSNVVGLMDRMEKSGLVERRSDPGDRRCYSIVITKLGKQMVEKIEKDYLKELSRIMSALNEREKTELVESGAKIRETVIKSWKLPALENA